jgi:delta 1-pyrroline-5-carboxylate dehydrogenase
MDVDRAQIARIVEEVVRRCTAGATLPAPPPSRAAVGASPPDPRPGVFGTLDEAVAAARKAQQRWMELSLEKRAVCIRAMRETAQENARAMDRDGPG